MTTCALISASTIALCFAGPNALADNAKAGNPPTALPPGMARANEAKQVAALYREQRQKRVKTIRNEPKRGLTDQEAYNQKLIAYRTQLVEEQRQRRLKELELQLEREARLRAEKETAKAELEVRRQVSVTHHQAVYVHHRWLRYRDCWQRQRRGAICELRRPNTCSGAATAHVPGESLP